MLGEGFLGDCLVLGGVYTLLASAQGILQTSDTCILCIMCF